MKMLKYRLNVWKQVYPLSQGVRRFFFLNLFLCIIIMISEFFIPVLYGDFIEKVIIARKIAAFIPISITYLVIHVLKTGMTLIKTYDNNRIKNRIVFRTKYKIWKNLLNKDIVDYEKQDIGEVKMRLEDDVKVLADISEHQTIEYLLAVITVAICVILLFTIEYRLAFFSVICIPVTFALDRYLSKKEMVLNNEQRENDKSMNTWLFKSIQGWQEIKALNLRNQQRLTFIRYIKKYAMYYAKWIHYWTIRVLIIPKLRNEFCMQFGLYFLGGLLIIYQDFKIGSLLIFAMYFNMLSENISKVSSIDAGLQGQKPYYNRIFEELQKKSIGKIRGKICENITIESIEFQDVSFGYSETQSNVVQDMNLRIDKGERLAITGESGCGKTTVLKLMLGLLKPGNGQILISNQNIDDYDLTSFHKKIGCIMQDSYLFDDTIVRNLQLAKSEAGMDEIIEACKRACIYDDIMNMPEGFETRIGERGKKLSGGQRQRLVLARTFLRDVDVFVFDEATSALDEENEKKINDAIMKIGKDKIIIVVAHREAAVNICTRKLELFQI